MVRAALQTKVQTIISQGIGSAKRSLHESQKEVSRDITPRVQEEMSQAYGEASQQHGVGTDVRQKAAVQGFVDSRGGSLFEGVVEALRDTLDRVLQELGAALRALVPLVGKNFDGALEPILHAQKTEESQVALRHYLQDIVLSARTRLGELRVELEQA